MAEPVDVWHVKRPRAGVEPCSEHSSKTTALYPSAKHGQGKRWAARYRDAQGRQKSPRFDRKIDASNALIKALGDLARGAYVDAAAGKLLFAEYARQWLDRQTFDTPTRETVERAIRLHLVPTLGKRELRRIKPPDVQALMRALQRSLGPGTIQVVIGWLSAILDAAVDDERIAANPCRARSVKRPSVPTRKVVPWESERTEAIRAAIRVGYPSMAEVVTVGEGLGLRIGEALALSPDDIDWLRGVVHVRRQIRIVRSKAVFALPKRGKERDVPLAEAVSFRLAGHLEEFPARAVTLPWGDVGGKPTTANLMFTTATGKPWWRNHFGLAVWDPAVKAAAVPEAPQVNGFHALRHRFASVVLAGGATIRDLADWLGHEDPGFTLKVYSHLMPASADRMRSAINASFKFAAEAESAPGVR